MHLHGGFGNADIARNLFAKAAVRDLNHDLALPGAQRLEAFPEGGQSFFILPPSAIHKVSPFVGSRTPSERLHLADAPALAPFHSDSGFDARRDVQSPHTDKNAYLRENHH